MARQDEDEGDDQKPYPRQGEKWQHIKTGHVVKVFGLHMIWSNYKDGASIYLPLPCRMCTAKSDIKGPAQCVIFKGSEQVFVREIGNFLERFERV